MAISDPTRCIRGTRVTVPCSPEFCHIVRESREKPIRCSVPGDIGSEKVNAVPIEVPTGPIVMFYGAGIGVPGKDLCIAKRNPGVERVGDGRVTKRMRADGGGGSSQPSRCVAPSDRGRGGPNRRRGRDRSLHTLGLMADLRLGSS